MLTEDRVKDIIQKEKEGDNHFRKTSYSSTALYFPQLHRVLGRIYLW